MILDVETCRKALGANKETRNFRGEISSLSNILESLSKPAPLEEAEIELPEVLEGFDKKQIALWISKVLGISVDELIVEKRNYRQKVTIDQEDQHVTYNYITVYVRSKTNGMFKPIFNHTPAWIKELKSGKSQFSEEDRIRNQQPSSISSDVEKSMIDRELIEDDGKNFLERVRVFKENLDSRPFIFGTIDQIKQILYANFGDLASLISLSRSSYGGENLGQGAGVSLIVNFSGETGDISPRLLDTDAENSNSALNPDGGEAVYQLDLNRLRVNLIRKGLEIKKETIIKGTFEEIRQILEALEVLKSHYGEIEHVFFEEKEEGIEIGYMGGFDNKDRGVDFTFPKNGPNDYEVDWSVFTKKRN